MSWPKFDFELKSDKKVDFYVINKLHLPYKTSFMHATSIDF